MSTKCAKCFKGDQSNNDSDESDSEKGSDEGADQVLKAKLLS